MRALLIALLSFAILPVAEAQPAPEPMRPPPSEAAFSLTESASNAGTTRAVDRFLHMAGAGMLGAGLGTGILWLGAQSVEEIKERRELSDQEQTTQFVLVTLPWLGAMAGSFAAAGVPSEEIETRALVTSALFSVAGSLLGYGIATDKKTPFDIVEAAGFVAGTGIGAAVGAALTIGGRDSLFHFTDGRWSLGLPGPAPAGGMALLRVQL